MWETQRRSVEMLVVRVHWRVFRPADYVISVMIGLGLLLRRSWFVVLIRHRMFLKGGRSAYLSSALFQRSYDVGHNERFLPYIVASEHNRAFVGEKGDREVIVCRARGSRL